MKRSNFLQFVLVVVAFLVLVLLKGYLDVFGVIFFLGGLVGFLLYGLDHLIHVFVLKPQEETSVRALEFLKRFQLRLLLLLLLKTASERADLIFRNIYFQLVFLLFSFFVVSSSGSVFGVGIVLAFSFRMFFSQVISFLSKGSIGEWFLSGEPAHQVQAYYLFFVFIFLMFISVLA